VLGPEIMDPDILDLIRPDPRVLGWPDRLPSGAIRLRIRFEPRPAIKPHKLMPPGVMAALDEVMGTPASVRLETPRDPRLRH
jgi:hypothetical protein